MASGSGAGAGSRHEVLLMRLERLQRNLEAAEEEMTATSTGLKTPPGATQPSSKAREDEFPVFGDDKESGSSPVSAEELAEFDRGLERMRKRREVAMQSGDEEAPHEDPPEHREHRDGDMETRHAPERTMEQFVDSLVAELSQDTGGSAKDGGGGEGGEASQGSPPKHRRSRRGERRSEHLEMSLWERELHECTFQPQINPLPSSMAGFERVPFHERSKRWADQKKKAAERMAEDIRKREQEGCTFKPATRSGGPEEVAERPSEAEGSAVAERLYRDDGLRKRKIEAARLRAEREEEFQRTCTFRPALVAAGGSTADVRPRYMEAARQYARKRRGGGADENDASVAASEMCLDTEGVRSPDPKQQRRATAPSGSCTFTPRINTQAASVGGPTLQSYLKENAFDRLSRVPRSITPSRARRSSLDFGSAEGDGGDVRPAGRQTSSRGERPRPASAQPRRSGRGGPEGNTMSFQAFLERQGQRETARRERMELLERSLHEQHVPHVSRRSEELVRRSGTGDFLRRQERLIERRRGKRAVKAEGRECTFTPKINRSSRARRGRSADELSHGDALRRKVRQETMRLQAERRELSGVTFRPALVPEGGDDKREAQVAEGRRAGGAPPKGRLRVTSEPDTFLERMREEARLRMEKNQMITNDLERRQMEECTFQPQVRDAPPFVKRIARSMALARSAGGGTDASAKRSKPAWMQ